MVRSAVKLFCLGLTTCFVPVSASLQGFTASEVKSCVQLCSVASDCLPLDSIFTFDAETSHVATTAVPSMRWEAVRGSSEAGPEWRYSETEERVRLVSALEDRDSPEAAMYEGFIDALKSLDGRGGGMEMFGDGGLPDGMTARDLMRMLGVDEALGGDEALEGVGEEQLMAMLQEMMGGMGGMGDMMGGYGDEYGGGGGYGMGYGGGYGGGGYSGGGYAEDESGYDAEVEEEDDFE